MKIALISDTHGDLPEDVIKHLKNVDQIWHAGDIGGMHVLDQLTEIAPTRAVFGNIDDHTVQIESNKNLFWNIDGLKFYMTHIGGYPPRYNKYSLELINQYKPDVFICGHSHILKVMRDKKRKILHMNPGACGFKGFHQFRTFLLFEISNAKIINLNVVDMGLRSKLN